jgi:hypothetical protein
MNMTGPLRGRVFDREGFGYPWDDTLDRDWIDDTDQKLFYLWNDGEIRYVPQASREILDPTTVSRVVLPG